MIIGALQPGYLPWLGYFDQISKSDLFIFYDDLAYTKQDWRNRNNIKGHDGKIMLTVPVFSKKGQKINEVKIDNSKSWQKKHLRSIIHNYMSAPYLNKYINFSNEIFNTNWERLIDINMEIIHFIVLELGIKTKLVMSSEMGFEKKLQKKNNTVDSKTERIILFMKELGGDVFLEGAAGKNYINEELLKKESIKIIYQNYQHPVYNQQFGEFIPYLSVIDLMLNHGDKSLDILSIAGM